jgi:hypothetical protein
VKSERYQGVSCDGISLSSELLLIAMDQCSLTGIIDVIAGVQGLPSDVSGNLQIRDDVAEEYTVSLV